MSPENPLVTGAGMVCLAIAAGLLSGDGERRLGAAALLLLGLALAAWHAGSAPGTELAAPASTGRGFLVGNAALLLLGSALVCVAVLRAPHAPFRTAARVLAGAGIVLIGPALAAFIGPGGPVRALVAASGLGLTGAAVVVGARGIVVSRPGQIVTRRLAPPPLAPVMAGNSGTQRVLMVLGAAVAIAALARHVFAVFVAVEIAAWAGYLASHSPGSRPVPVGPVLTLLLIPAIWLLATIAGPVGLRLDALGRIPLSPAAELLIEPTLLLAAWGAAGLWPLQRQLTGALTAPAGALLLARVAQPLGPTGLEHWQPLTAPVVMLGLWNAAAYDRWSLLLAGAGFLGIAAGSGGGVLASFGLLATGLTLELCAVTTVLHRARRPIEIAAWPLVTLAGVATLQVALEGEVVYTVLGTLALALIVAARRAGAASEPSRPR